jgi:hypothetical protein
VTVNVALSADTSHKGGHLHAILEGKHQIVEREEGEATVHTDDVMHGVSAMRGGERCAFLISLIASLISLIASLIRRGGERCAFLILFFLFLQVLTTAPFLFPSCSPQVCPHPLLLPRVSDDERFGHGAGQQREARGE